MADRKNDPGIPNGRKGAKLEKWGPGPKRCSARRALPRRLPGEVVSGGPQVVRGGHTAPVRGRRRRAGRPAERPTGRPLGGLEISYCFDCFTTTIMKNYIFLKKKRKNENLLMPRTVAAMQPTTLRLLSRPPRSCFSKKSHGPPCAKAQPLRHGSSPAPWRKG